MSSTGAGCFSSQVSRPMTRDAASRGSLRVSWPLARDAAPVRASPRVSWPMARDAAPVRDSSKALRPMARGRCSGPADAAQACEEVGHKGGLSKLQLHRQPRSLLKTCLICSTHLQQRLGTWSGSFHSGCFPQLQR